MTMMQPNSDSEASRGPAVSPEPYAKHYRQSRFRRKVVDVAGSAGRGVIERALRFWYALGSPALPWRNRLIIYGALGYFILPVDLVPDFIPALGFVDDMGVLMASLTAVAQHITPEVKRLARQKADRLFGHSGSDADLIDE